jgi:SAM-dependent methyltransferase
MTQRTKEWEALDERAFKYHLSQWDDPKRSTIFFSRFVQDALVGPGQVVDLGCGAGAATAYIAERCPNRSFLGIDLSSELIQVANQLAHSKAFKNLSFRTDDWFNLGPYSTVDGVISLQSISWLPEFETPLEQIFEKISPRWVALSSLFYEGDISCKIEVDEHSRDRQSFYNVYSLPAVARFCARSNYRLSKSAPFHMDIDIPKPADPDLMGTYTVAVQGTGTPSRLQISGPLLMNWYCVLLERATDS